MVRMLELTFCWSRAGCNNDILYCFVLVLMCIVFGDFNPIGDMFSESGGSFTLDD